MQKETDSLLGNKNKKRTKSVHVAELANIKNSNDLCHLESVSGRIYKFPGQMPESVTSIVRKMAGPGSYVRLVVDSDNHILKIDDYALYWPAKDEIKNPLRGEYEYSLTLYIISMQKGLVMNCNVETNSLEKMKEFFVEKGVLRCLFNVKEAREVIVLVDNLVTFSVPSVF